MRAPLSSSRAARNKQLHYPFLFSLLMPNFSGSHYLREAVQNDQVTGLLRPVNAAEMVVVVVGVWIQTNKNNPQSGAEAEGGAQVSGMMEGGLKVEVASLYWGHNWTLKQS